MLVRVDASPAGLLHWATAFSNVRPLRSVPLGLNVGDPARGRTRLPRRRVVDHMHLVQVPIVLGRGVRIWDGLEALENAYDIEAVSSPSGITHLTFTRKVAS
jgi:hypothetical protein